MNHTAAAVTIDGFAALVLDNGQLEACFIPQLGGRMVSLRAAGGREWLFHPGDEEDLRLWRNRRGEPFWSSTHAGLDECLPTVAACRVAGRDLPDHGVCWTEPWTVDCSSLFRSVVRLSVDLPGPPLRLERTASLTGRTLHLNYRLSNLGTASEPWAWAFHGLLRWQAGDHIVLPDTVRSVAVETQRLARPLTFGRCDWPSPRDDLRLHAADLGGDGSFMKLMAGPLEEGRAALVGADGQRLTLRWDVAVHPWLGLWITRGGYLGQHGIALEPSNLPGDNLERHLDQAPILAPGATVAWWVECVVEV